MNENQDDGPSRDHEDCPQPPIDFCLLLHYLSGYGEKCVSSAVDVICPLVVVVRV